MGEEHERESDLEERERKDRELEEELDRAMGKVSEADFADMAGRLRARALRVMQQLDDAPEQ